MAAKRSIVKTLPGAPAFLILIVVLPGLMVAGCASDSGPLSAEELEEVAHGIDKGLMCPICPTATIDQSQVGIANQMQIMVREKLDQGKTRDEIFQFFVDRYGPGILAKPPKSGFNLLVWVIPPFAMLLGTGVLTMTVRAMRQGHREQIKEEVPVALSELEPYLSLVDQEIRRLTLSGGGDPRSATKEGSNTQAFEEGAQ
jgi:cytochrome c-type biogenesis protein CcmH